MGVSAIGQRMSAASIRHALATVLVMLGLFYYLYGPPLTQAFERAALAECVDKTGKNVIGIGEFEKDGAGPNVCAPFRPPMAGTAGITISTMEGKFELTCKDGKLLLDAKQNIKINAKTTIEIKAGTDIKLDGSSTAKLTSGSPSNYDAPQILID